jgi:serine/threonine protein kinase
MAHDSFTVETPTQVFRSQHDLATLIPGESRGFPPFEERTATPPPSTERTASPPSRERPTPPPSRERVTPPPSTERPATESATPPEPSAAAFGGPPGSDASLFVERTQVDAGPPPGSTSESRPMSKSVPPPATWAPGAVIPGTIYRVIRPLGMGGMGEVYEAEHELLGIRRALKVLSRRLASREDLAERLRIEARALARLRHVNLVEVNDLGVSSDGRVFFAMELLSGATLRDLLRRSGALRVDQAIAIATQILDALDAAHLEGMVHRDVKPENVFVQRSGVVKLLDFGVAKALQGNNQLSPLTAAGVAIGTPRYMAPEQAQGQQVDPRSDVYAVGLVFWEMLAGRPPYHHLDALAAVVTASAQGLPDIATTGVSVPADVKAALQRATSRSPADRYRSAAAFAADLRMARSRLDGTPTSAEKVTTRYEASLASLMPMLSEMTDLPGAPGEYSSTSLADPTRVSTTPPPEDATTPGRPPFHEPTEVLTLRDSLPFDPREQPTPTSIPASPRASAGSSPSLPPPAPLPTPLPTPARGAPWWVVPVVVLASILGTWLLLRPSAPPAAPSPPPASALALVQPSAASPSVAQSPATPPVSPSGAPPEARPAAPALDSGEKTAEAPPVKVGKAPAVGAGKARPAETKKIESASKPSGALPGSGLLIRSGRGGLALTLAR